MTTLQTDKKEHDDIRFGAFLRSINPPYLVASVSASNVPGAHSESDLIARILNGEASLFHALVTPCERPMFFKALSLLDNEADAEDVVQEAALKAFRSLAGFRNESSFKTWIIKITLNEARAMLRKRRRFKCESLDTCIDSESKENASRDVPDVQEPSGNVVAQGGWRQSAQSSQSASSQVSDCR